MRYAITIFVTLIIAASIARAQTSSLRSEWHRGAQTEIVLRSEKSTDDIGGYQLTNTYSVHLRVLNPHYTAQTRVRAVIMSICDYPLRHTQVITYNRQFDLPYTRLDNGFFGHGLWLDTVDRSAPRIPISGIASNGDNYYCRQEIAVLVDNDWLRDPISASSNFRFQL